jgi:hypothetical protein
MSGSERFHRDDPDRITPRRKMSGAAGTDPWNATAPLRPGDRTVDDPVEEGVNSAYRVIDEHMREGRRSAQRFANRWEQEGPPGRRSLDELRTLAHRIVGIYADSIPILIDLVQSLGSSLLIGYRDYGGERFTSAHRGEAGRGGFASARWREGAVHFAIEVSSNRRVRITIDIDDPDNPNLVVPALVDLDAAKSPLREVSFVPNPDNRRRRLNVVIPMDQAPGIYTGAIVDERTRVPCGFLSIDVVED